MKKALDFITASDPKDDPVIGISAVDGDGVAAFGGAEEATGFVVGEGIGGGVAVIALGHANSEVVGESDGGVVLTRLTQGRLTALRGYAPRRCAPVQNAYKPSAFFNLDAAEGIVLVGDGVIGIGHATAYFEVSFLVCPASSGVFRVGEAGEVFGGTFPTLGASPSGTGQEI